MEQLEQNKYFTTLDLTSGYHQIPIAPGDRKKTAFTIVRGHYEYNRLPFGISNGPATFQKSMDELLGKIKGQEYFVYLDDIIIFSRIVSYSRTRGEVGKCTSKAQRGIFKGESREVFHSPGGCKVFRSRSDKGRN